MAARRQPRPRRRKATVRPVKPSRDPRPRSSRPSQVPPPPPPPPGAQPRAPGRPADNTTCDVYFDPNVPPAAPNVAGVRCHLAARFQQGAESAEGDQDFRWTHLLLVDAALDVRDTWPAQPAHRVYVPDKNGTGFDVVFVEMVNRGQPGRYRRVFLKRRAAAFPTTEL
jgi:hypothetical protein